MKIKNLETDYDVQLQQPVYVDINIPNKKIRDILEDFFNKMEYKEKREWINKNATIL